MVFRDAFQVNMRIPDKVLIREVGPREGIQSSPKIVPTADKVTLIEKLAEAGLSEIEVTSWVRPDKLPQMADSEELVNRLKNSKKLGSASLSALYLNQKGFLSSVQFKNLNQKAWLYTAASDTFLKNNSNCTHADFLEKIESWVSLFKEHGRNFHGLMISTAFGCGYEGLIPPSKVVERILSVIGALKKVGETMAELALADTVGWGTPDKVMNLVTQVRAILPEVRICLHLHDTRGMAMANAYAGLLAGVDCFETSVGGVGGCPFMPGAAGNLCTEDFVYMLNGMGIQTGIDLDLVRAASKFAANELGLATFGRLANS